MKLLEIQSSPRGESSDSIALTPSFIEACESSNTSMVVDALNVWHERLTASSDFDIALFAPTRFTRETARDLWSVISTAPAKIHLRVETPYCGFSLEEFARERTEQVPVRLPANRQLAADSWAISVIEDAL
jgi:hypothetical protein